MATMIKDMCVRGAGLIGAAAGAGMHLAARSFEPSAVSPLEFDTRMREAGVLLCSTRPTAVDLSHAVARVTRATEGKATVTEKQLAAVQEAQGTHIVVTRIRSSLASLTHTLTHTHVRTQSVSTGFYAPSLSPTTQLRFLKFPLTTT